MSSQLILLTALCLITICGAVIFVLAWAGNHRHLTAFEAATVVGPQLTAVMSITACTSIVLILMGVRYLLLRPLGQLRAGMKAVIAGELDTPHTLTAPSREWQQVRGTFDRMVVQLRQARAEHEQAQRILAERTSTVDRLLEFSQTIQGAGRMDQIFWALVQFLEAELKLAGVAIVSHQPDVLPPIQLRAVRPEGLIRTDHPLSDIDGAMCPSLRQNLAKQFRPEGSPVRCAIDACLSLPTDHPAFCIPFNVGRSTRLVAHMLLPIGVEWTEARRQLAQTYVNSAVSALITLHLLEQAERQSMTDALTGLYNRRSMDNLLQREVALAERHRHPLTVVMIDMDKFKEVNDTYGHAAGDHMLKSFAECVRITLRKTDLAFRYGGDEFVIALPQTPLVQAEQVVSKLRQAFAAVDFSSAITRLEHQPTLSIGVAERSPVANILTLDNLLAAADQALYQAKQANRNCVKIYSPPRAA